jgi:hypothetical protein
VGMTHHSLSVCLVMKCGETRIWGHSNVRATSRGEAKMQGERTECERAVRSLRIARSDRGTPKTPRDT